MADTPRADVNQLDELHGLLAGSWKARLEQAKSDPDKPLTAAEATSLAKFLADNGIRGLPSSPRMAPLKAGMDALNDDKDDNGLHDLDRFRTTLRPN